MHQLYVSYDALVLWCVIKLCTNVFVLAIFRSHSFFVCGLSISTTYHQPLKLTSFWHFRSSVFNLKILIFSFSGHVLRDRFTTSARSEATSSLKSFSSSKKMKYRSIPHHFLWAWSTHNRSSFSASLSYWSCISKDYDQASCILEAIYSIG